MPTVELVGVRKRYPSGAIALADLDFTATTGEITVIVGASGAGKSTLLRTIAGLETPDSGQVRFDGRDVTAEPPHRRGVALVSQKPAIYPHLTVERNLAIGAELAGSGRTLPAILCGRPREPSDGEIRARVMEAADLLGLSSLLKRRGGELSGGEQQRVALGRAMVRRAELWLLDEPLAHLDPPLRGRLRRELHLLHARSKATMIIVTHDPVEALALADRLVVLDAGAALTAGSSALNRLDGPLLADWPLPPELAGRGLTAAVRAVDLTLIGLEPPADAIRLPDWEVERVEPVGPLWLVHVRRHGRAWTAWHVGPPPTKGGRVHVLAPPERVVWFDGDTGRRLDADPPRAG